MAEFVVSADQCNPTLAAFVRTCVAGLSWSDVRRHIHARRVKVNGVVCVDDARRLAAGDRLELLEHSAKPLPSASDVEIVYRDDDLLVIDKPAGMECERRPEQSGWSHEKRRRHPTVVECLEAKGLRVRPVHRLDRDTSGLMHYALNPEAQRKLIAQLAIHAVKRVYLAVAIGEVQSQTVKSWIVRDRGDGLRGSVPEGSAGAQEAITEFVARESLGGRYTLLECHLQTGRTHQIRIHLAEMGHPLCGEKMYARKAPSAEPVLDGSGAPRHALHSARLELDHPITGTRLAFECPLPADLATWIRKLG